MHQLVETRPDQGLETRRHGHGLPLFEMPTGRVDDALIREHLDRLLEKERVAAGVLQQGICCSAVCEGYFAQQLDKQRAPDLGRQRLELDRDPPLALSQQLGHRLNELRASRGNDE